MILACQNVSKAFGTDEILRDISFHINEHEKAAIVGINGAGKSTLLKIIVGEYAPDSGSVAISKGATLGYLSQTQNLTSSNTIYEEVLSVKADVVAMETNIRRLEQQMKDSSGEELDRMLKSYSRLNADFEAANGYALNSEVTGVLKGLGFEESDFTMQVNTLSGGQKTRVALAKLLLEQPDIIILDEPTNHLDLSSVAWLENFLSNYKGAVIVVAHDRYFIDKVATKIIEIENKSAMMFLGNYSAFAEKKKLIRAAQIKAYLNQQQEIKHQEEVIEKLRSFNREKSIKRARSREKMLDKIERIEKPIELNDKMDIRLEPNILSGNDVLTVKNISKAFGDNTLFTDLSFEIKRGDRVAILGNNGTGKTTLLKIINSILPADSGEYKLGAKVYIGYYDQELHVLNPENTLFEEIQDEYPDMDNTRVRNILAAFLFTGDDVFKLIRDLSGGEKARVSLAKLMLSDANLLILDEPTNHLDMVSKEILEQAVAGYTGTVVYVSHDRYFINKTATRVFELVNKCMIQYSGNYDYYLEKRDMVMAAGSNDMSAGSGRAASSSVSGRAAVTSDSEHSDGSADDWAMQKKKQAALRKAQNDLAKCEQSINTLESRNAEIDAMFDDPSVATDAVKLHELTVERADNDRRLEELMQQWEDLSSLLEG